MAIVDIIKGTHKDVWAMTYHRTIATYYPDIQKSGLFGTECFYFDYQTQSMNLKDEIPEKLQNNYKIIDTNPNYILHPKEGIPADKNYGRNLWSANGVGIEVQDYGPTDRISKIGIAWINYLTSNKNIKPNIWVIPSFLENFIKNKEYKAPDGTIYKYEHHGLQSEAWYGLDNMMVYSNMTNSSHETGPDGPYPSSNVCKKYVKPFFTSTNSRMDWLSLLKKSWSLNEEKQKEEMIYNMLSPFAHFPPLVGSRILDESLFFEKTSDSEKTKRQVDKYVSWYGSSVANKIMSRLTSLNRSVKYSELITQYGSYGFKIDMSLVGLPEVKYTVPFDDFIGTQNTLERFVKCGLHTGHRKSGSTNIYEMPDFMCGQYPNMYKIQWDRRDGWIQAWSMGGKIPENPRDIMIYWPVSGVDVYVGIRWCPWENKLYPICLKYQEPDSDFWETLVSALTFFGSIVYSSMTGDIGGIIKTVTGMVSQGIQIAFPGIASYVNFGTTMFMASMNKKLFADPDGEYKTQRMIMDMSAASVQGGIFTSMQAGDNAAEATRRMNNVFKTGEGSRIKDIIAAIAELKEERLRTGQAPGSVSTKPPIVKKEEKKKESSGLLLAGAVVVGALALKKLLKKGK